MVIFFGEARIGTRSIYCLKLPIHPSLTWFFWHAEGSKDVIPNMPLRNRANMSCNPTMHFFTIKPPYPARRTPRETPSKQAGYAMRVHSNMRLMSLCLPTHHYGLQGSAVCVSSQLCKAAGEGSSYCRRRIENMRHP